MMSKIIQPLSNLKKIYILNMMEIKICLIINIFIMPSFIEF